MKRLMIALALALAPATALAQETHGDNAEVVSAPADDAVLAAAPSNISLTFEHAVILTQVQVHGPGHTPIPVSHTAPTSPQAAYVIALPALASGAYEVHWNATGDGHAMEGTLHFTVQ
ncbi:MAG: copper resistance protein CopC [Hydrogenophilaceae bacterium]|jgi:hypothetical protein|nr:copper resistance protein CopC [Hydrogenophilaceae bacterium]